MPIDAETLNSECSGKWYGIFSQFGIEINENPKKHVGCPVCGIGNNNHRFRFTDKFKNGSWICNQCGAGTGFQLLMKVFGWDFPETLKQVAEVVGMVEHTEKKEEKKVDPAIALRHLYSVSKKLEFSDPVMKYLRCRGLVLTPNDVMFCPQCYESDTKKNMPAMVAIIRNKAGMPISMHRTYLSGDKKADIPSPRKIMPPKEPLAGSAIRLFNPSADFFKDNAGVIGVAEGIETAIAAAQLFQVATWSCMSTTILESFEPPEGIREVTIYADSDNNYSGERSAYILANKLYLKDYLVDVKVPDTRGFDFNSVLLKQ